MNSPFPSKRVANDPDHDREGSPAKRFASSCEENREATTVATNPLIHVDQVIQQNATLISSVETAVPLGLDPVNHHCNNDSQAINEMNGLLEPSTLLLSEAIAAATTAIEEEQAGLLPSISPADIFPVVNTSDRRPVMSHSVVYDEEEDALIVDSLPETVHLDKVSSLEKEQPCYESGSEDDESYHDDSDIDDPFVMLLKEIATSKLDHEITPPDITYYTGEERETILDEARDIGLVAFIEKYVTQQKVPLAKLIELFNRELEQSAITSAYFTGSSSHVDSCLLLHRFLRQRRKLPHINTIDDVVRLMREAKNIIVLTGAGVSVSCGIPDFRSANGIYSRMDKYPLDDPQQMFDIEYFRYCPEIFFSFAKEIYPSNFKPSPSHSFIRLLEEKGRLLRNYTQNIDTLEQSAGIERVLQCHGSFATARCIKCHYVVPGDAIKEDIFAERVPRCPQCAQQPGYRIFGENLPSEFDDRLAADREEVDLLIVMGTSLKVAPVSGIMGHIPHRVPQIVINKTPIRHMEFDVQLLGDCDVIVPDYKLPNGTSHGEPGTEPFEFVPPNFHLFNGAVLDEEAEEAPDTELPLDDTRSDHELLDGLPSDIEEEEAEEEANKIHEVSSSIASAIITKTTTDTAISLNPSSTSTSTSSSTLG
ncbi:DHS-like NAD/FAD-binding domain-containing protein [Syncephalis plumigaleata]|nr:DHS-like NAD/FAD-binding domain-containing protein [Syncephalis plumigaleata]